MDSVGDLDRISALPDELLHLILAAVGDAVAVTRTAALSRRWRCVWMHAQRLLFVDSKVIRGSEPGRLGDFVDWVFARHADADIESLNITHTYRYPAACITPGRVNQWLRYAMQCVVQSLDIRVPYVEGTSNLSNIKMLSNIEMPGHGRMLCIRMSLCDCRLQLPMTATAKYEALTELVLSLTSFDEEEEVPGGARTTLGDFVSRCCPRLRKLQIKYPNGLRQLVLRTDALEELNLCFADDLGTLDVVAPNLRVLKLSCCMDESIVKVSAKSMEEVGVEHLQDVRLLDIGGLTNVRCLGPIDLYMHGQHHGPDSGGGLWLLKNCPGADHIKLSLFHWEASNVTDGELIFYLTQSQCALPLTLPNVRTMEVTVKPHRFPEGHLVASLSSLLLRFPNLRSLCVDFLPSDIWGSSWRWGCLCSRLDTWLGPQVISLRFLETVKISGFIGADEEIDLVSFLFASSNSIKSMTTSSEWTKIKTSKATTDTPATISLKQMMAEGDNNGTETVAQKLTNIPSSNRGLWQFREDVRLQWRSMTAIWNCERKVRF